jgi:hypothetical protein
MPDSSSDNCPQIWTAARRHANRSRRGHLRIAGCPLRAFRPDVRSGSKSRHSAIPGARPQGVISDMQITFAATKGRGCRSLARPVSALARLRGVAAHGGGTAISGCKGDGTAARALSWVTDEEHPRSACVFYPCIRTLRPVDWIESPVATL